jgi:hypothetical protein
MGNIPLVGGAGMTQPAQKSGVSADWNGAAFRHAQSIVEGFNKMGQTIGNELVRAGKSVANMKPTEQQKMDEAYSIKRLELARNEDFSNVSKEIDGKTYASVEDFDADWDANINDRLDKGHEDRFANREIVRTPETLKGRADDNFALAKEAFRQDQRRRVETRVTQQRQTHARRQFDAAVEARDFGGLQTAYDLAVTSGIPVEQAQALANAAAQGIFFGKAQDALAGAEDDVGYQLALSKAVSGSRDKIGDDVYAILSADVKALFDAVERKDFGKIFSKAPAPKSAGGAPAGTSKKSAGGSGAPAGTAGVPESVAAEIQADAWGAATKAGHDYIDAKNAENVAAVEEALKSGYITEEQAAHYRDDLKGKSEQAKQRVSASTLQAQEKSKKESQAFAKSVIEAELNSPGSADALLVMAAGSGKFSQAANEQMDWLRKREEKAYDDKASVNTLLWIYMNAKNFSDSADKDGSYRMAAFALARKNCNTRDYMQAVEFLNGGNKDSAGELMVENGMSRLFSAAGLDANKVKDLVAKPDDAGLLASYLAQVVKMAGELPAAQFNVAVDALCDRVKNARDARARIDYMSKFVESAQSRIDGVGEQMMQSRSKDVTGGILTVKESIEEAKAKEENERMKAEEREEYERKRKEAERAENWSNMKNWYR